MLTKVKIILLFLFVFIPVSLHGQSVEKQLDLIKGSLDRAMLSYKDADITEDRVQKSIESIDAEIQELRITIDNMAYSGVESLEALSESYTNELETYRLTLEKLRTVHDRLVNEYSEYNGDNFEYLMLEVEKSALIQEMKNRGFLDHSGQIPLEFKDIFSAEEINETIEVIAQKLVAEGKTILSSDDIPIYEDYKAFSYLDKKIVNVMHEQKKKANSEMSLSVIRSAGAILSAGSLFCPFRKACPVIP